MNRLQQWLASHSITSKTAVSAWAFLALAFYAVPQFHAYVMSAYSALPKGIHAFLAEAAIPLLIFWQTRKRENPATAVPMPTEQEKS